VTLTIEDLRDDSLSGFRYVRKSTGKKPFQACKGGSPASRPDRWHGPRRASAEEAAEDYIAYANGSATPATPALKSAGHKPTMAVPAVPPPSDRERELLAELREVRDKRLQGSQGFIYCIAEKIAAGSSLYDSRAVKVGWARDPDRRIKGLQTGNPRVLKILGTIPATKAEEPLVHAELQSDNVLHEWFKPTPAVLSKFGIELQVMGVRCFTVKEAA